MESSIPSPVTNSSGDQMDENERAIKRMADKLRKAFAALPPLSPSKCCCIFRVRSPLRDVNQTAYAPKLVSIGPLHNGNGSLEMMDYTKRRFLNNFIKRPNVRWTECLKIVKEREETLRDCYGETFPSGDDFVRIILLDAIFIVELFLTIKSELLDLPVEREWKLYAEGVLSAVGNDLLLLENQLPFYILENIWKCATDVPIKRIFFNHFNSKTAFHWKAGDDLEKLINYTPKHFVDLVRKLYLPLEPRPPQKLKTSDAPSVIELRRAGVKFNVIESSKSLLDVSFSNGILEIPKWRITNSTEGIFRNLMAFEKGHCEPDESYICHYLMLMRYLLHTPRDVDLLVKKKIIENYMGNSNKVSTMIYELGYRIPLLSLLSDEFYFADVFDGFKKHCEISGNKPWKFFSFCPALPKTVCSFLEK